MRPAGEPVLSRRAGIRDLSGLGVFASKWEGKGPAQSWRHSAETTDRAGLCALDASAAARSARARTRRGREGRKPRRNVGAPAAPPWGHRCRASSGCEHWRGTVALGGSVFIFQFLESAGEERPAPATFGVKAFKQKAYTAYCPFKALAPPDALCPLPLPVAPLREAGFVLSPRPDAAMALRARAQWLRAD